MTWKTVKDELHVPTKRFANMDLATTKRQVLTTVASLFDPLGLLFPTTIKMKMFLQELWIRGQQWDDEMDDDLKKIWKNIISEMQEIEELSVPRYIGNAPSDLLCFSDASANVYATVIYLRTFKDGKANVNLIFAKSRVAPKKNTFNTTYGTSINFNLPRRTIGIFYRSAICGTLILCCFAVVWFGPVMMVIFIILPLLLHILSLVSLTYHRTILLLLHKLLPNNLNTLQNVTVAATITNANALFPTWLIHQTYQHSLNLPPRLDCLNQSYLRSSSRVSL